MVQTSIRPLLKLNPKEAPSNFALLHCTIRFDYIRDVMAVPLPLNYTKINSSFRSPTTILHHIPQLKPLVIKPNTRHRQATQRLKLYITRAIEEGRKETQSELIEPIDENATDPKLEVSELGKEIQKAMEERKETTTTANDLLSGVLEEIREIEWPAFQKVLGTTGVVLGVIAGSSVVLLTVNAVLAELSDKVFAGREAFKIFSPKI